MRVPNLIRKCFLQLIKMSFTISASSFQNMILHVHRDRFEFPLEHIPFHVQSLLPKAPPVQFDSYAPFLGQKLNIIEIKYRKLWIALSEQFREIFKSWNFQSNAVQAPGTFYSIKSSFHENQYLFPSNCLLIGKSNSAWNLKPYLMRATPVHNSKTMLCCTNHLLISHINYQTKHPITFSNCFFSLLYFRPQPFHII